MLCKIGISVPQYHSKDGVDYKELNASFSNEELTPSEIASLIHAGHAFTVWLSQPWRVADNYMLGQHLALDFDEGVSMSWLRADRFISQYASYIYATPSWTPEKEKYRVLFLLDTPIMQAKNYRAAAESLLGLYGGADPKCKDPVRFFYGASQRPDAGFHFNNKILPLDTVKRMIAQHVETAKPAPQRAQATFSGDGSRLMRYWEERVSTAAQGQRNDTLNRAAFSLGELVKAGTLRADDVRASLVYAAAMCGLRGHEVDATIASGFRSAGAA